MLITLNEQMNVLFQTQNQQPQVVGQLQCTVHARIVDIAYILLVFMYKMISQIFSKYSGSTAK